MNARGNLWDASHMIEQRIERLRMLSWEEAARLPERDEEQVAIGGTTCALTTYRQASVLPRRNAVLVTVQLARPRCFGVFGDHLEQGLVFEPGTEARPATASELLKTGG